MNTETTQATQDTTATTDTTGEFNVLEFKEKYNFKTTKLNTKALTDLEALATAGKVVLDDVLEDGVLIGKKRQSQEVTFECIDLMPLLEDSGLSATKIKTLQDLVQRHVVAKNKDTVDSATFEFTSWDTALEDGLAQRKAGIKITAQMVADACKALVAYLRESTSTKEGGINLTEKLATKRFTVASCNSTKNDVLEHIQGLVVAWYDSLGASDQLTYSPVVELWADNLEETLNPEQDDATVDMF